MHQAFVSCCLTDCGEHYWKQPRGYSLSTCARDSQLWICGPHLGPIVQGEVYSNGISHVPQHMTCTPVMPECTQLEAHYSLLNCREAVACTACTLCHLHPLFAAPSFVEWFRLHFCAYRDCPRRWPIQWQGNSCSCRGPLWNSL